MLEKYLTHGTYNKNNTPVICIDFKYMIVYNMNGILLRHLFYYTVEPQLTVSQYSVIVIT